MCKFTCKKSMIQKYLFKFSRATFLPVTIPVRSWNWASLRLHGKSEISPYQVPVPKPDQIHLLNMYYRYNTGTNYLSMVSGCDNAITATRHIYQIFWIMHQPWVFTCQIPYFRHGPADILDCLWTWIIIAAWYTNGLSAQLITIHFMKILVVK